MAVWPGLGEDVDHAGTGTRTDLSGRRRVPESWPVLLQANTAPQAVKAQIEWGLTQGGPQALTSCDAFVQLSLSGHLIDWKLVRAICEVATEMWDAILHDEGSGFDVTLDDLP